MRKIALLLAALTAMLVATPASAQSLDRILGLVTGATAYGYNSCSYVDHGIQQASCQANRALNVISTIRQNEQQADYRQRERFERRTRQLDALQRACKAGDTQSCARSGGVDPQQMEIARALMDACSAGDRASCRRADQIMAERNIDADGRRTAYAEAPRYAETPRYDQAPRCRPVLDPATGQRIIGQTICR